MIQHCYFVKAISWLVWQMVFRTQNNFVYVIFHMKTFKKKVDTVLQMGVQLML